MAEPYQRSHIASVTYLSQWAVEGRVRVVRPGKHRESAPARPEAVAYRKKFWSSEAAVQKAVEEACGRLESEFPSLQEQVATDWPLGGAAREALAEFIGLHVIRTPAWMQFHDVARAQAIAELEADWDLTVPFERAAEHLRSDRERVKAFRRHLQMATALVVNMHWTLISWDEPVLATGDHPVALFPMSRPGVLTPYEALPRKGLAWILELRFPLSPWQLFVGSWLDGPDFDRSLTGTGDRAINANESVVGHAEHEWFFRPGAYPIHTPAIQCRRLPSTPISLEFGVDAVAVLRSQRRRHALAELHRIGEADDNANFVRIADFSRSASDARHAA